MITFSLPDMVRRAGTRRTSTDIRVIEPTKAQVDQLARVYMKVVRAWALIAKERIMPAYARSLERRAARDHVAGKMITDDIAEATAALQDAGPELQRLLLTLTPELRDWFVTYERYHRGKWTANVLSASGIDLALILGPADAATTLADLLAWNVSLIADVAAQAQSQIAAAVFSGYQSRQPSREVAKRINEVLQGSKRRARFIASDQANKLSSALDQERRRQAGLDWFRWRSSHKRNFRPEHQARDLKEYTDATAPKDRAGTLPGCGCKEQAILKLN